MYVRRFLLPFLAIGVVSTPLFLFNDDQPQLGGASLTLSGNSACPPFPEYGTLFSTNVTQAGNDIITSQITHANATETASLPAINSSASIVASPSTTGVSDQKCTKVIGKSLSRYRFPTYDLRVPLLSAEDRFFVFQFTRNGGGLLLINVAGRPQDSPDIPESYSLIANEAFVDGNLHNSFIFVIDQPLWVNVHLNFIGARDRPFSYVLELFQIDLI